MIWSLGQAMAVVGSAITPKEIAERKSTTSEVKKRFIHYLVSKGLLRGVAGTGAEGVGLFCEEGARPGSASPEVTISTPPPITIISRSTTVPQSRI
jgi:hypothetical protein